MIEPEGVMHNNRRPDMILTNFQNSNKETLLDFTSISALARGVVDEAWKQGGYTAARREEEKRTSYVNAYDTEKYEFLPLVMELDGSPRKVFAKFIKQVANKASYHYNAFDEEPRIYRSQFAHKLKCRIVLAFMKTQAQVMLNLQRQIYQKQSQEKQLSHSV